MSEEIKSLDLDEMLGEKQTVKVKRDGVEYLMRDINSFSGYELLKVQNMRRKVSGLQAQEEITEDQANDIEKLFDVILNMLCEKLPITSMAYAEKATVISFYFMEVRKKKVTNPIP